MPYFDDPPRLPRDRESLTREIDAVIKITDIRHAHRHREAVEPKWWEPGLVRALFVSGLGFLITAYRLIPDTSPALFWFFYGWTVAFVVTLITVLEHLLTKLAALRRLHLIQERRIDELERRARSGSGPVDGG